MCKSSQWHTREMFKCQSILYRWGVLFQARGGTMIMWGPCLDRNLPNKSIGWRGSTGSKFIIVELSAVPGSEQSSHGILTKILHLSSPRNRKTRSILINIVFIISFKVCFLKEPFIYARSRLPKLFARDPFHSGYPFTLLILESSAVL